METKRTRRTFTHEFKKQAVERVISGGEIIAVVAQDLGIHPNSLHQWVKGYKPQGQISNGNPSTNSTIQAGINNLENKDVQSVSQQTPPLGQSSPQQADTIEDQSAKSNLQKVGNNDFVESRLSSAKEIHETQPSITQTTSLSQSSESVDQTPQPPLHSTTPSIKTKPANMSERPQDPPEKPAIPTQPEGFQIKFCTIHPSKEEAIRAGQEALASRSQQLSAKAKATPATSTPEATTAPVAPAPESASVVRTSEPAPVAPAPVARAPEPATAPIAPAPKPVPELTPEPPVNVAPPTAKTFTLNLPEKNKRNGQVLERQPPILQRGNDEARRRVLKREERLAPETPSVTISDFSQSSEPPAQPNLEQYQERNFREQNRDFRQKQKKNKQLGNERYQNRNENRSENRSENRNEYRPDIEEVQPERIVPERPARPVPTAAEGRSWKVKGALSQRPNYRDENEKHGYVDEFSIPAKNLNEVWQILSIMQDSVDKRAFSDMVHSRQLNVPEEVLEDPKACTMQGPNVPNKPWLRKPRMHQVAEEFFQTTPEYAKAVYENYCGIDIRLDKNSDGTPILAVQKTPTGDRSVTIDFSKFDRFVDDFYGDFVRECKEVMMKRNPREYSSLNSFIRIPDEPLWNPKLWAGVRTFIWNPGETLSEAWINYASNNQRKNQRYR